MNENRVIVLGCGMVGTTIARDLARDPDLQVTAADISDRNLARIANTTQATPLKADLSRPELIKTTVENFDLVVGAMPSVFAFAALRAIIEAGKPYCDISFFAEDALELDDLAKRHHVTAVVDCGVAPGLANMIIGHAHATWQRLDSVAFYVGGLPKIRRWPYQYKAPFSPSDVIEEYTRPARLVENGQVVIKPALSDPELIDFPGVGTLEAFNTDGLRSLIRTIDAPNMKEKTLRWPGHIELMRVLRETGFFAKAPIDVGGFSVRPLDLTAKLLFPLWTHEPNEPEFTLLRVVLDGQKDGSHIRQVYELYDEFNPDTGETSMARTTGFPAAIVARMLLKGEIHGPGVLPPELVARQPSLLHRIIHELADRGVSVNLSSL